MLEMKRGKRKLARRIFNIGSIADSRVDIKGNG